MATASGACWPARASVTTDRCVGTAASASQHCTPAMATPAAPADGRDPPRVGSARAGAAAARRGRSGARRVAEVAGGQGAGQAPAAPDGHRSRIRHGALARGLFRGFSNRRQLAADAGLAPSPWRSGRIDREQGISKAGNPRLRTTMIELAWLWLRYQPESALSRWFHVHVQDHRGRIRRICDRRAGAQAVDRALAVCQSR